MVNGEYIFRRVNGTDIANIAAVLLAGRYYDSTINQAVETAMALLETSAVRLNERLERMNSEKANSTIYSNMPRI